MIATTPSGTKVEFGRTGAGPVVVVLAANAAPSENGHVDLLSDRFTVIDVFAHDRRGLLYTIASLLLELGLSVSLAKISTHLDQVLDVFYVTDREGVKLRDEGRLSDIQNILAARIEEFETHGQVATAAV